MAGGILSLGSKTKKDPMRQSSAMTTVFLLQQNQKFEQFMKAKVDDLETRVAAQQARLSAKEEQVEKEIWTDLDGLDDLFVNESTLSKQATPVAVSTGQHPAASLEVRDGGPRQPGVSKLARLGPDDLQVEDETPGSGGDDDTTVDILALMMGNDDGGGNELAPGDEVQKVVNLAPTVAAPLTNSSAPVTAAPALGVSQPPLPPAATMFNVDSEYEPLFANRFAMPILTKPAVGVEPTQPFQTQTATGKASSEKQKDLGEEIIVLQAERNTDLTEEADPIAGGLPDWDFALSDETEDDHA